MVEFVGKRRLGENGCLEGTTERSDGNRVRSARCGIVRPMCLEGTTPQDKYIKKLIALVPIRAIRGQKISLRTSAWNFRASERRAELVRAMPSAAENLEERQYATGHAPNIHPSLH